VRIWLAMAITSALIACSGAATYAALPNDPGRVVRIDMTDFAFSPASISKSVAPAPTLTPHPTGSMGDDDGEGH
jgi:hypothetical protein